MARLTPEEREELLRVSKLDLRPPPDLEKDRWVPQTPEGRLRYMQFAAQAAKFFKGTKPVRFGGEHWKL